MAKDTMEHIEQSDLIQVSCDLLSAVVKSTNILKGEELDKMNEEKRKQKLLETRTVLGFLNAANSTLKSKMQYFRMVGVGEKVEAIKKQEIK